MTEEEIIEELEKYGIECEKDPDSFSIHINYDSKLYIHYFDKDYTPKWYYIDDDFNKSVKANQTFEEMVYSHILTIEFLRSKKIEKIKIKI